MFTYLALLPGAGRVFGLSDQLLNNYNFRGEWYLQVSVIRPQFPVSSDYLNVCVHMCKVEYLIPTCV